MKQESAKGFSLRTLTAVFAGGNMVGLALRMAGNFLAARFTDPKTLGLFNGMGLVIGYAPFLQLGILNGLNRELPFYYGRNEHEKADKLSSVAHAWALMTGGGSAFCLLVVAVWYLATSRPEMAAGWFSYAITIFLLFYAQFYLQVTYRTRNDFAKLAVVNVIQFAAALALVVLVWRFNFYGLCLRSVIAGLIGFALLWYWRPLRISPAWDYADALHLLKIGAPIFGVGQLYALWIVLDSTLVLKMAGAKGLGLYQLALMTSQGLELIPNALSQVSYPRMAQEYGRTNSITELIKLVAKPMLLLTAMMLVMVPLAWISLPPLIKLLLPAYREGIAAAQWALLAIAVQALSPIFNIFNVVKRQDLYAIAIICGIITYGASVWFFLHQEHDLTAFPKSMLAGRIIFLLVCYCFLWRLTRRSHAISI